MSRAELPTLPPPKEERRVEVTDKTFTAWDFMGPWGVTGVAFLRDRHGGFTVWTPGRQSHWVWRGPRHISQGDADLLAKWLTRYEMSTDARIGPDARALPDEAAGEEIWAWDPDPKLEGGIGLLRLSDGSFELSLLMTGLVRGRAQIERKDGVLLSEWITLQTRTI